MKNNPPILHRDALINTTAMRAPAPIPSPDFTQTLARRYLDVRKASLDLVRGLSDADMTVQSMDDASPAKWHLAHTTWFFEEFILGGVPDYAPFDQRYRYLFNSYYEAVGPRQPRSTRGLLTRPSADQVLAYRAAIDQSMLALFERGIEGHATALLELGLHHEQQHQELLLTDLLNLFSCNPLKPVYRTNLASPSPVYPALVPTAVCADPVPIDWIEFDGGLYAFGHDGEGFAFDCEGPRHDVWLRPFAIASRPVTNREWCAFVEAGGYRTPGLWLSDGWKTIQDQHWSAPLYWQYRDDQWWTMTLGGETPLDPDAPATHISFFEADPVRVHVGVGWAFLSQCPINTERFGLPGGESSVANLLPALQFSDEAIEAAQVVTDHGLGCLP